ncbi:ABC transporter substrate-binding protein [Lachnoclostridium sp. Marseille-P6806]|uniref:ABC transporter substrate-binding protein n=1 Tax=Lachnoclostridium sp. Marseille-P6806 TaxID=2364793 RepID=UPI00103265DC|nr:extracellular solute-binding protein [Lachnoclostridium sp. Marseille-P6806]
MNRKLLMLLAASSMALSLAACGSSGTGTAEPAGTAASDSESAESAGAEETTETAETGGEVGGKLVVWEHTAQFEEPLKAVIEGFHEAYPDVEVEYSVKTSDQYYNLLQTAMQANECPDVFWTNGKATTNYESYVEQGLLMELTDLVDWSTFDDTTAMNIVTLEDGSVYQTPTAETGGRAVFYNKDIFEENGWKIPKTFSEFEELLRSMKEAGVQPISLAASDPWNILFIWEPILAAQHLDYIREWETEGYVNVNDERVVDSYNTLLKWGEEGYFGPNWTGATGDGATIAFATGQAAMVINGTWNISTFEELNPELNFGAFQLPTEDGEYPFVATNSAGMAVSAKTQNKDAALAFVNYFVSVDGQTRWLNASGGIPCTTKIVAEDPVVREVSGSFTTMATSYYDILGHQAGTGDSPCNVWEEDQLKILTGAMSVQDFVDELQALCLSREEYLQ